MADKYLDALYGMTLEELWKPIFVQGYENQFIAMKSLHPEFTEAGQVKCKLVGRAVTAVYAPTRPDYYEASCDMARANGWTGTPNQWVIDRLTDRDVLVVDMYDKIYKGTFRLCVQNPGYRRTASGQKRASNEAGGTASALHLGGPPTGCCW